MQIVKFNVNGTTENIEQNIDNNYFGTFPTTLQEKIDNLENSPELNEIMAELLDMPDEESEEE